MAGAEIDVVVVGCCQRIGSSPALHVDGGAVELLGNRRAIRYCLPVHETVCRSGSNDVRGYAVASETPGWRRGCRGAQLDRLGVEDMDKVAAALGQIADCESAVGVVNDRIALLQVVRARKLDRIALEIDSRGIAGKCRAELQGLIADVDNAVSAPIRHAAQAGRARLIGHGITRQQAMLSTQVDGIGTGVHRTCDKGAIRNRTRIFAMQRAQGEGIARGDDCAADDPCNYIRGRGGFGVERADRHEPPAAAARRGVRVRRGQRVHIDVMAGPSLAAQTRLDGG